MLIYFLHQESQPHVATREHLSPVGTGGVRGDMPPVGAHAEPELGCPVPPDDGHVAGHVAGHGGPTRPLPQPPYPPGSCPYVLVDGIRFVLFSPCKFIVHLSVSKSSISTTSHTGDMGGGLWEVSGNLTLPWFTQTDTQTQAFVLPLNPTPFLARKVTPLLHLAPPFFSKISHPINCSQCIIEGRSFRLGGQTVRFPPPKELNECHPAALIVSIYMTSEVWDPRACPPPPAGDAAGVVIRPHARSPGKYLSNVYFVLVFFWGVAPPHRADPGRGGKLLGIVGAWL